MELPPMDDSNRASNERPEEHDGSEELKTARPSKLTTPKTPVPPPPIVSFYQGGCDFRGRTLAEIISWSDSKLEYNHDYIQVLFPLPERSNFMLHPASRLDELAMDMFKEDHLLRAGMRTALARMLRFFGFDCDIVDLEDENNTDLDNQRLCNIVPNPESFPRAARNWMNSHNDLRITRIIRNGFSSPAWALDVDSSDMGIRPSLEDWSLFLPSALLIANSKIAVIFLVEAVLLLQPTNTAHQKRAGAIMHSLLIAVSILLFIGAFTMIVLHKIHIRHGHFDSPHSVLGLTTYIAVAIQTMVGVAQFYTPSIFGSTETAKSIYKYHRVAGYIIHILLFATLLAATRTDFALGPLHLKTWKVALAIFFIVIGRLDLDDNPQLNKFLGKKANSSLTKSEQACSLESERKS
ncbi:hypothetical protein Dda_8015 [Drechslerella dactyloides]|uniref:Cytochrome b561 domain-containing protein n=1 Tax=Drechslerella dactyloides TaxID=74499 RepID=A0AAD6IT36_DREDA|nr:hypothetical protein Dda_8015 [Drechslerella dactyloides]